MVKTFEVLLGDVESAYDEINGAVCRLEHYGFSANQEAYDVINELDELSHAMYHFNEGEGIDDGSEYLMQEATKLLKRIGA